MNNCSPWFALFAIDPACYCLDETHICQMKGMYHQKRALIRQIIFIVWPTLVARVCYNKFRCGRLVQKGCMLQCKIPVSNICLHLLRLCETSNLKSMENLFGCVLCHGVRDILISVLTQFNGWVKLKRKGIRNANETIRRYRCPIPIEYFRFLFGVFFVVGSNAVEN